MSAHLSLLKAQLYHLMFCQPLPCVPATYSLDMPNVYCIGGKIVGTGSENYMLFP